MSIDQQPIHSDAAPLEAGAGGWSQALWSRQPAAAGALAGELDTASDITAALTLVSQAVHSLVPAADLSSLTVFGRTGTFGAPRSIWTSRVPAGCVDELQYRHREGPVLDVVTGRTGTTVLANDLLHDHRWPMFGPAAADVGVRSALAISLIGFQTGRAHWRTPLAAVSLYAHTPGAFTPADKHIALPLAMQGAMAVSVMSANKKIEQLRAGLATRNVIGQAQGILMAQYGMDADQAFDRLKQLSQNSNIKLRDVAEALACTGSCSALAGVRRGVSRDASMAEHRIVR